MISLAFGSPALTLCFSLRAYFLAAMAVLGRFFLTLAIVSKAPFYWGRYTGGATKATPCRANEHLGFLMVVCNE